MMRDDEGRAPAHKSTYTTLSSLSVGPASSHFVVILKLATMLRLPWASVRALGSIATHSPDFPIMRAGRAALVDKTSAIADLLNFADPGDAHRIFFARPRKFGKSLTLSIAATMLAAGPLPSGAVHWPGHEKVKIKALFGGLQVHERLLRKDATLRDLLKCPHFVIHLDLGGTRSGSMLSDSINLRIAAVARRAFGSAFGAQIAAMKEPADALDTLIEAVPSAFPIALLVDEYDAAIVQDVSKGRWDAANVGLEALRSLTMSTKTSGTGSRIKRCIITGVTSFANSSLFSSANNFTDVTGHPLLSRVLGFSEAEIRTNFPTELQRLADSEGTDVDGAVQKLAHWYNGYCFDGDTTSFIPYPVLCALKAGKVTEKEMDAASGLNWLGLSPRDLSEKLVDELVKNDTPVNYNRIDTASLELQSVCAVPHLLQVGLLSLQPGQKMGQQPQCHPPIEFARKSLQIMAANALSLSSSTLPSMNAALLACDHGAFTAAAQLVLTQIPNSVFKRNTDRYAPHYARTFSTSTLVEETSREHQTQARLHVQLKAEEDLHSSSQLPASTPLPGHSAYTYRSMTELPGTPKGISMACLGAEYTCVLVDSLQQLPHAVSSLLRFDPAAPLTLTPLMADGEFDHVLTSRGESDKGGRRRFASRMALLTLLRGTTAYSFHLPTLFTEDASKRFSLLDPEEEGTSLLLRLIHTQQVVTWGGTGSDIPALAFALPALKLPLKGWVDLQKLVDQGAKSGVFPPDVPLSLSKVAMREFGVTLNKSYQLANWGKPPTPLMLAYAATDVVVLQELYKKYKGGMLFAPPQGVNSTD